VKTARNGMPFQGAIGADSTAICAAPSSQLPDGFCARKSVAEKIRTKDAPASDSNAASRRVCSRHVENKRVENT
jgi:hypothetical protein